MTVEPAVEYLTASEAARLIGISVDAVRVAANGGRLRVAGTTGGRIRLFLRADVERFRDERQAKGSIA